MNYRFIELPKKSGGTSAGRRIICGVAVSETGIHPTRAAKRRLRAASHAYTSRHYSKRLINLFASRSLPSHRSIAGTLRDHIIGLTEFLALKTPKAFNRTMPSASRSHSSHSSHSSHFSSTASLTIATFGRSLRKISPSPQPQKP